MFCCDFLGRSNCVKREKLRDGGGGQMGKLIYFLVIAERSSLQGWVFPAQGSKPLTNGGYWPLRFMPTIMMILTRIVYKIVRVDGTI